MIAETMDTTEQVKITHRRFTVAEFLRPADIGFLREAERVELIRGEIVEIVNLPDRKFEVYREPQLDGYRMTIRYTAGESLSCLAFPDIVLKVDDFIGSPSE